MLFALICTDKPDSFPLRFPPGVRMASTITALGMGFLLNLTERSRVWPLLLRAVKLGGARRNRAGFGPNEGDRWGR